MELETKYHILGIVFALYFLLSLAGVWLWMESDSSKDARYFMLSTDYDKLNKDCDNTISKHTKLVNDWNELVPKYEDLSDDCNEMAVECKNVYDQYTQCNAQLGQQRQGSQLDSLVKLFSLFI